MLMSCKSVPATPENARSVVEHYCEALGPPRHSFDMLQTVMCRTYNYKTGQHDLWGFMNSYEAGVRRPPELNPSEGKFVLEYEIGSWRIVSEEDFTYYFGRKTISNIGL